MHRAKQKPSTRYVDGFVQQRRGQDSLKTCLQLFAVCSNDMSADNLRCLTNTEHITRMIFFGKPQRYKNATKMLLRTTIGRPPTMLILPPFQFTDTSLTS